MTSQSTSQPSSSLPTFDELLSQKISNLANRLEKLGPIKENPKLANDLKNFSITENLSVFKKWFIENIMKHIPKENNLVAKSIIRDHELDPSIFKEGDIDMFIQYLICFKCLIVEMMLLSNSPVDEKGEKIYKQGSLSKNSLLNFNYLVEIQNFLDGLKKVKKE